VLKILKANILTIVIRIHMGTCWAFSSLGLAEFDLINDGAVDKNIDLIIGGPPCQGMSLSGPRKFDDPRNKLYLSYIHFVEQIKPKAFVI